MPKKRVGILLAGGFSQRFGSPKAFAQFNGKKFYEISYEILNSVCDHVVIVTRPELIEQFPNPLHTIVDMPPFQGCGPLAGIYSAMMAEEAHHYIVLPCDMPLLKRDIVENLYKRHQKDVTVTVIEGRLQPLVSIWDKNVMEKIKVTLDKKLFKMTEVLNLVEVEYVEASELTNSPRCFLNVNTPKEAEEAKKWVPS